MDAFSDLAFFSLLVKHGSLVAAAQQLGVTPPAVSKRLAAIERRLGVRLLQRTTRRDFSVALLMAQSTLATVALILAILFVRSLRQAQVINPGFNVDHVAIVGFDLGMLRYDNAKGPAFVRRVNDRLRTVPV